MKSVRILMIVTLIGGVVATAHAQANTPRQCAWVLGAVKSPISLTLQRRVRLSEILAIAGGTTKFAGPTVTIVNAGASCSPGGRENAPPQLQVRTFRIAAIQSDDERVNPYLSSGDIVMINETDSVFVTGAVTQPLKLVWKNGMTASRAIVMAGGLVRDARTDQITIHRTTSSGQGLELIFDFDKIRKQRAEDPVLQPNDIIEVRFRDGRARPFFLPARPTYDAPLPVPVFNVSRAGL